MTSDISAELGKFIAENDNFLLLTHEKPDGDALGSIFGLFTVLRDNGKKVDAFLPEQPPMRYASFVPDGVMMGNPPELDAYSWILCLDTATSDRLGIDKSGKEKIPSYPVVNIDHHPDNKLFGKLNLINPESAATAEILFGALKDSGKMRISQEAAAALLIGIVMDTGGFRFDNTKPSTFNAASELLALGAEYPRIINAMFFSQPLNFIRMEAELVLNHLKTACSGQYAWVYLSDEILKTYGVDKKDTEMLIDAIRKIEGVEIAVVFYKKDDGFKISMRSKNKKYSVAKIARALNGGGHELAAGGFIKTDRISEAENTLLSHVAGMLEESL
ncbi:MAG: bifunctional oligoribonuclease/PAP phosphatase NrnA [Victivallales bacterium]|jgi:phosphoesterase RecJ-like protein